jgi:hypothetical protein
MGALREDRFHHVDRQDAGALPGGEAQRSKGLSVVHRAQKTLHCRIGIAYDIGKA